MAAKRGFCMRCTDIAIIGGGLAGSTAAAMLGRAGISTVLVDPHPVYPCDFRVEKLSGNDQLARLFKTGIAESVLRSTTHEGENWIARFGYLLDRKPSRQYGIMYDALIQVVGKSRELPFRLDRPGDLLEPAAPGAVLLVVRRRFSAPHARALQRGAKALPSLLLVVLILIVVFIVVIGLTGRAMRVAALIVPELAIGAVARKQFGV
jgi:hypothetical protein